MREARWKVVALVAVGVLAWLGLGPAGGATLAVHPSSGVGTELASQASGAASPPPAAPTGPATPYPTGANLTDSIAERAVAATQAAGLNPDVVYLPHGPASPAAIARSEAESIVSPTNVGAPSPMGLADYGLSGSGDGALTPSILNTSEVRGIVDTNATGIQGADLYLSDPESFSIQLNAVLTDVTLFGVPGYTFWAQDVVTYSPGSGSMVLVSNIWNFSGAPITSNAIASHGPNGTNDAGDLGYYYSVTPIATAVSYPFNLTLTMVSSLTEAGQDSVSFQAQLVSTSIPTEDFSRTFDFVDFSSEGASSASPFEIDGFNYNPAGLLDDLELDIGGPGSGSQVDLGTADAQLGLAYWTGSAFNAVPSAYSYGSDTAESSVGANVAWSNDSTGAPGGLREYGTMTTGPSLLTGLWGLGAPEGSYPVTLHVSPANAFEFFFYNGTATFSAPIVYQREYAPTLTTATYYLMAGSYLVTSELADHEIVYSPFSLTGRLSVYVNLSVDTSLGVYTPLWAFSNSELAALAASGSGTPSSPYVLYSDQLSAFADDFGLYNEMGFPVFPGVFLRGTNATTELLEPPSFAAETNDLQPWGTGLPATNDLQYWLWNTSGVAIVRADNLSGWFTAASYYPLAFNPFSVVLYESSHDLVAGDRFEPQGLGLLLYAGGTAFGALNLGGGNNTVWGNAFLQIAAPSTCPGPYACLGLMPFGWGLGLEIAEDHDLTYNNEFGTPTTAWLLPMNLVTGRAELFDHDAWNISVQPASDVLFASGFPTIPLSGSIAGGTTQGGNAWWDCGISENWYNGAINPLGSLPYVENATTLLNVLPAFGCVGYYCRTYIYPGGDLAPVTFSYARVTLSEHGLPAGSSWGVSVACEPPRTGGGNTSGGTVCCAPPRTGGGNGSSGSGGCTGTSSTSTGPCANLPATGGWPVLTRCPTLVLVHLQTSTSTLQLGLLPEGVYAWAPLLPPGYESVSGGTLNLTSTHPVALPVTVTLAPSHSVVTVRESGLRLPTPWRVAFYGASNATSGSNATIVLSKASGTVSLANGPYNVTIGGVPGFTPTPEYTQLEVNGPTVLRVHFRVSTYTVAVMESGLVTNTRWAIRAVGPVHGSGTGTKQIAGRGSTLMLDLPNGTFLLEVLGPRGWSCSGPPPASAPSMPVHCLATSVTVSGSGVYVAVDFAPPALPATPAVPGAP